MSTPSERIEIFNDTLNWIRTDYDLSASIPFAKEHTTIYIVKLTIEKDDQHRLHLKVFNNCNEQFI